MTGHSARVDLSMPEAWGDLVVGETLGPLAWSISREEQQARLDALEVEHPWYRMRSPLGGPLLFPILFMDLYYKLMDLKYDWALAIAARLEIEFCRPARADEMFVGTLQIVDRYQRRGGRYVVTTTSVRDALGRDVCVLRNWALLNPRDRYGG